MKTQRKKRERVCWNCNYFFTLVECHANFTVPEKKSSFSHDLNTAYE